MWYHAWIHGISMIYSKWCNIKRLKAVFQRMSVDAIRNGNSTRQPHLKILYVYYSQNKRKRVFSAERKIGRNKRNCKYRKTGRNVRGKSEIKLNVSSRFFSEILQFSIHFREWPSFKYFICIRKFNFILSLDTFRSLKVTQLAKLRCHSRTHGISMIYSGWCNTKPSKTFKSGISWNVGWCNTLKFNLSSTSRRSRHITKFSAKRKIGKPKGNCKYEKTARKVL